MLQPLTVIAIDEAAGTVTVGRPCMLCDEPATVTVSAEGMARWQAGAYVQDAFPELDADQREILISGSHPSCFAEAFPEEEDDEVYPETFPPATAEERAQTLAWLEENNWGR